MQKIIVVAGPTASGKTALGIELAKLYNGEVVSADSMQIYRDMTIGTAKPTAEEMGDIPHHMIDVVPPTADFSVSHYANMATACVDDILSRGKLPIIVGGTGLYIDSLVSGRSFAENYSDDNLREKLYTQYDEIGGEAFREMLRGVDPDRADILAPNDKKRLVRALEVYKLAGKTITEHDAETKAMPPRYDAATIILNFADRADLYARIDKRVDIMVAEGLIEEVTALKNAGVPQRCTAMQAIGYKEIYMALDGKIDMQSAIDKIKQDSRRYAKRQLTWFRRNPQAFWLTWEKVPNLENARRLSTEFLRECGIR